jgi:hypothetical protein
LIIVRGVFGVTTPDFGAFLAFVLDIVHRISIEGALIVETDVKYAPASFRRGAPICQFYSAMRTITAFHAHHLLASELGF